MLKDNYLLSYVKDNSMANPHEYSKVSDLVKDDKKYARICQGNFTEQLTYIHDKFRTDNLLRKVS